MNNEVKGMRFTNVIRGEEQYLHQQGERIYLHSNR